MNLQNIMAQAKKMQGDLEKINKEIEGTIYTGESQIVKIKANGSYELLKVKINNEDELDIEMLEDMVLLATNDVLKKIKKDKENKMGKMSGGLGGLF